MRIHAFRRGEAADRFLVSRVLIDQPRRNAARAHDLAAPINIDQKGVQRTGALLDAALQSCPFRTGKDAGKHVEGDQPVRVAALAINGECNTDPPEKVFGLRLLHLPQLGRHVVHPFLKLPIRYPDLPVVIHLVEIDRHSSRLSFISSARRFAFS